MRLASSIRLTEYQAPFQWFLCVNFLFRFVIGSRKIEQIRFFSFYRICLSGDRCVRFSRHRYCRCFWKINNHPYGTVYQCLPEMRKRQSYCFGLFFVCIFRMLSTGSCNELQGGTARVGKKERIPAFFWNCDRRTFSAILHEALVNRWHCGVCSEVPQIGGMN